MNCCVTAQRDRAARVHRLLCYIDAPHLGAFAQVVERDYITFVLSVCLSVRVYQPRSHAGRMFVKFDIWDFCENMSRFSYNCTTISGALREDLSVLCIVVCRMGKQNYRLGSGC